jgi:phospholipid/cholesterol/gamma-HCH transport system permease protein
MSFEESHADDGDDAGRIEIGQADGTWTLRVRGRWDISAVAAHDRVLRAVDPAPARAAVIDLSAVNALDSAGAWALHRTRVLLRAKGIEAETVGATEAQAALMARVAGYEAAEIARPRRANAFLATLARLGADTLTAFAEARHIVGFFGLVVVTLGRSIRRPRRIRFTSLVSHMESSGLNALPIVGLLSFLIGVVLAYQGVDQLRRFGAEIFAVNLLGISIVREIAVLMTAILIAGRSGSAYTAQIGTMKVNQEVDAMHTLGLDPIEVLVLPRLFALIITLPLLAFYADMVALLGGAITLMALMELSPVQFLKQLNAAIPMWSFWIGLIKAPFFAFAIALIGCYEGLKVSGSAESVGRLTTQSVVESIFLVLVLDAAFSIMFSYLGI